MLKRKRVVICIIVSLLIISITGCVKGNEMTLADIAYDGTIDNYIVYLKESEEYAPYIVLTDDYNENVLLLRKYLLPEVQQYKIHSDEWSHHEYGSYYEESSIDKFLNEEFFNSLSNTTQEAIVDSVIEITDLESYDEWNYKTCMISRKVFLLSSIELGVEGLDGNVTTKEGNQLEYFKNSEFSHKKAYMQDGTEHPYWTRTPELWESYLALMVGTNGVGESTVDIYSGVRPAFCMSKEVLITKSSDIIDGEVVYVIEEKD